MLWVHIYKYWIRFYFFSKAKWSSVWMILFAFCSKGKCIAKICLLENCNLSRIEYLKTAFRMVLLLKFFPYHAQLIIYHSKSNQILKMIINSTLILFLIFLNVFQIILTLIKSQEAHFICCFDLTAIERLAADWNLFSMYTFLIIPGLWTNFEMGTNIQ